MFVVLSALKSTLEDALAERGQPVVAVVPQQVLQDRRAHAAGRYAVRGIGAWDDRYELAKVADDLAEMGPVTSIETTDEPCLRSAALLRGLVQVDGPTWSQSLAATDKAIQKTVLGDAGVPVAAHRRISRVADAAQIGDELGWPIVIKPRMGYGTLGTRIIGSRAALADAIAGDDFGAADLPGSMAASGLHRALDQIPGGLMVEECINVRREYHVEVMRVAGEETYVIPARYVAPVLGSPLVGSVLLQPGKEFEETAALARAAADALGLFTGWAHVEVLLDGAGVWRVGEIGLRPGGAKVPWLLRHHHAIDLPSLAADLAMGIRPHVQLADVDYTTAWVSAASPRGRVESMTSPDEIRLLPGVVEATTDLVPGQDTAGPSGSVGLATHVLARGATAEAAEAAALAAIRRWDIEVAESPFPSRRVA